MDCPHCARTEVYRIARTSVLNKVYSYFGRWPYKCRACGKHFHGNLRRLPKCAPPLHQPILHNRRKSDKQTATVVVQTDTSAQLDHILLALARAVSEEQYEHENERTEVWK